MATGDFSLKITLGMLVHQYKSEHFRAYLCAKNPKEILIFTTTPLQGKRCPDHRDHATCGQHLAPKHVTGRGGVVLRSQAELLSSGGRHLHDYRRAHRQLGNPGGRRLARAGAVCVILQRVRANSDARRAHLSV